MKYTLLLLLISMNAVAQLPKSKFHIYKYSEETVKNNAGFHIWNDSIHIPAKDWNFFVDAANKFIDDSVEGRIQRWWIGKDSIVVSTTKKTYVLNELLYRVIPYTRPKRNSVFEEQQDFSNVKYYNNSYLNGGIQLSPFDELQDMRLGQFDYWKSDKPKTDTIKGWIRYWIQPHWESMELNRTNDSVKFVRHYSDQINEVKFPAIAIYYKDGFTVDSLPESHPIKYHPYNYDINGWLIKIVVNEKEFDLSKKYEFIKAEEVVK